MREIKFRAWEKVGDLEAGGQMFSWKELKRWPIDQLLREDFVPMQFTGLKDKNGKDIYEGDIVKRHDGTVERVEWDYLKFVPDLKSWDEVIGNVYENPELISKEV